MADKPLIVAAMGGRGTGKSAWCVQQDYYTKAKRLMVWDLMREPWHAALQSTDDLGAFVRMLKPARFRVAFHPSPDDKRRAAQFEVFMQAAWVAGHVTVHVEELAFVTTAHKAPPAWRRACLLGRHEPHALTLSGTSQRPAQVDKEFLGNADVIHAGRLMGADADNVARILGVKPAELEQLPDLAYIERRGQAMTRGVLRVKPPAAARGQKVTPKREEQKEKEGPQVEP